MDEFEKERNSRFYSNNGGENETGRGMAEEGHDAFLHRLMSNADRRMDEAGPPAPRSGFYQKPEKRRGRGALIALAMVGTILLSGLSGYAGTRLASGYPTQEQETKVQKNDATASDLSSSASVPSVKTGTATSGAQLSVAEVAAIAADSVVEITTETVSTDARLGQYVSEGAGSGVIISTDGYIITNNHVIANATKIVVTLRNGEQYSARLVGTDEKSDIAVVLIGAKNLTPAVIGDSDKLVVGEEAVAIGNPLGQLGGTVTSGIISALNREITIDGETMTLLQTSAAINPGNSGGGLFNGEGRLVGIVNSKSSGSGIEGLGFAIPINEAKSVADELIAYGYVKGRIDLGVTLIDISDAGTAMMYRVQQTGLYVYQADRDSGFSSGDLIMSVDGKEITDEASFNSVINSHKVGDTLTVVVSRRYSTVSIDLTLKEYRPAGS